MKNVSVDKFIELEKAISSKMGDFVLFALFAREDLPDRWDLVFSATWPKSENEAIEYIVAEIKNSIGPQELTKLSRIVFVPPTDPPVQAINRDFHVEHGSAEVKDSNFFGLPIKHAYIITSRLIQPAAAK